MIYPIEVKNLYYQYAGKEESILRGINLQIRKGEVVGIVGLSGNGKSTLCYCMCGIIPHIYKGKLKGEALLFGEPVKNMDLAAVATKVGVVFQDPDTQLFSPTIEDEIAFGPENLCLSREEISERVSEAIDLVGMGKYRYSNPYHLSGGQKQLIALASILSLKPEILIFDEAMAQIDTEGRKLIKEKIVALKNTGKTILMVEHDFSNLDIADRIMVLKDGKLEVFQGKL
ncbi:ABC-type cobalt transport system, ATpase component [Clostridium aceticum]|uniref:ABC-type cobalt transport system, ATpase component n=1 Tax=Clostridium aceticum TaxID=84022 RepID=A0A0D8IEK3_9CLOT|nr:ABC transporter ATP-binding protein [Clostridium aceticum]AKL94371.1 ABC-type cobalt transport system, ATpase component [Clostridium aceticum]KJF28397.1 ABC transporter ATP-binding protein [Clostridium aceticum]